MPQATDTRRDRHASLGFPTANGNLSLTAVFSTFSPQLFDRKNRSKSNDKFTTVNGIYCKRQIYGKFTEMNGKRQIHMYDGFTILLNKQ